MNYITHSTRSSVGHGEDSFALVLEFEVLVLELHEQRVARGKRMISSSSIENVIV